MISRIVILFAMEEEGRELIRELKLVLTPPEDKQILSYELYSGCLDGKFDINVVLNGKSKRFGVDEVGTVPAALTTYAILQRLHPVSLIINAGIV